MFNLIFIENQVSTLQNIAFYSDETMITKKLAIPYWNDTMSPIATLKKNVINANGQQGKIWIDILDNDNVIFFL